LPNAVLIPKARKVADMIPIKEGESCGREKIKSVGREANQDRHRKVCFQGLGELIQPSECNCSKIFSFLK
jgi:hypothetical protein